MTESDAKCGGPGGYEAAIQAMRGFLSAAGCLRGVQAARREFEETLDALSLQRRNLEGSLVIAIVGGTGVGKSTLINAVAASEIARTSPVRPCTIQSTFYCHRENDIGPVSEVVSDADKVVLNDAPGLKGKIIVDPPDFDSMVASNRRKLLEILKIADMVVCVADQEKYRNMSLFRLLRRFKEGRKFVFLLNKADFGIPQEVTGDFRSALEAEGIKSPDVYAVSALNAFRARAGGETGLFEGDYIRFESAIKERMDGATIARIKDSNLSSLLSNVYASIKSTVPDGLESGLEGIRAEAEKLAASAARDIADEISHALFEDDSGLRRFVFAAPAMSLGGIFGIYLAAAEKFASVFAGKPAFQRALDPASLRIEAQSALSRADTARIGALAGRAKAEAMSRLESMGVDSSCPALQSAKPSESATAENLVSGAMNLVMRELGVFIEQSASGFLRNVAYNILPAAYVVYFAAAAVMRISRGEIPDVSFLLSFFVLLGAICFLQHALAERSHRRRGGRFMAMLNASLEKQFLAVVSAPLLPRLGEFSAALLDRIREFRRIPNLFRK